jgi:hypothetical protein
MDIQLPIPAFDLAYYDLVKPQNELVTWFSLLNLGRMERRLEQYYSGRGPQGFRKISFVLLDLLRHKQNLPSNRRLVHEIRNNRLYQHLTGLAQKDKRGRYIRINRIPTHQAISKFHRTVGIQAYRELLALTVEEANELGLLAPRKYWWRSGIQLASDSTFVLTKTRIKTFRKHEDRYGQAIGFGRRHHLYRVPLGSKIHWLISVPARVIVNVLITPAQTPDCGITLPLVDGFMERHKLRVAYHIADKGMSDDATRAALFQRYKIVGLYPLRDNAAFPETYSPEGWPRCPHGHLLKKKGTDYGRKRTQYYCGRICSSLAGGKVVRCSYLRSGKKQGYTFYTKFNQGMGKFGPLHPSDRRFKDLYRQRTLTEQIHSLAKNIRYRFEQNLYAVDPEEIEIQTLSCAICLNYDEIVKERCRRIGL